TGKRTPQPPLRGPHQRLDGAGHALLPRSIRTLSKGRTPGKRRQKGPGVLSAFLGVFLRVSAPPRPVFSSLYVEKYLSPPERALCYSHGATPPTTRGTPRACHGQPPVYPADHGARGVLHGGSRQGRHSDGPGGVGRPENRGPSAPARYVDRDLGPDSGGRAGD